MKNLFTKPLKLIPNLKILSNNIENQKLGKEAQHSQILRTINPEFIDLIPIIQDTDVISERLICSYLEDFESSVIVRPGKAKKLTTLLSKHSKEILGQANQTNSLMKITDTPTEGLIYTFQSFDPGISFKIKADQLAEEPLEDNQIDQIFSDSHLTVEKIDIKTQLEIEVPTALPIYLESGEAKLFNKNNEEIDHLIAGDERLIPAVLEKIILQVVKPSRVLSWDQK